VTLTPTRFVEGQPYKRRDELVQKKVVPQGTPAATAQSVTDDRPHVARICATRSFSSVYTIVLCFRK
jgi:hypothetical protein